MYNTACPVYVTSLRWTCVIVSSGLHLLHPSCPRALRQDFNSLVVGVGFAGTIL